MSTTKTAFIKSLSSSLMNSRKKSAKQVASQFADQELTKDNDNYIIAKNAQTRDKYLTAFLSSCKTHAQLLTDHEMTSENFDNVARNNAAKMSYILDCVDAKELLADRKSEARYCRELLAVMQASKYNKNNVFTITREQLQRELQHSTATQASELLKSCQMLHKLERTTIKKDVVFKFDLNQDSILSRFAALA